MSTPLIDWPAPISLGALILPLWPNNIFPEDIQRFVCELSKSTETPLELSSLTVLSGLATAAQGKYIVQIKPDYFEPVNIWTAVALPPGCRKSAVQKVVTDPLSQWERNKKNELEPVIAKIVSENESLEIRIKEMRRKAALLEASEYEKMKNEITALETQIQGVPAIPQLWTGDITPENLGTLMSQNNERMAVLSDEAGIFDILSGRYSAGIPNLDLFLQSHSGSPARVNRGSRSPVFLDHPALSMGLTPQPEILRGLTKTPAFRGRGLLARFLYAIPMSNLGIRNLDAESLSEKTKERYNAVIICILNQSGDEKHPHILRLSQGAYDDWRTYALVIEVKMAEDGPFVHIRDWAGKLPGAIARLAGLLHIARHASDLPQSKEISREDMKAAIRAAHILSEHALGVFDLMGADPALEGAKVILSWIQKKRCERFTFRDCHYAHKSRFKRAKEMEPSIEVLEERHFIREIEKEKKSHRPSRVFDVNLQIYEKESA